MDGPHIQSDSCLPRYKQLADWLEQRIRSGFGQEGQRICSDRELCKQSGLSLLTARQAIDQLVRKGILKRQPGLGTFLVSRTGLKPGAPVALFLFGLDDDLRRGNGHLYSDWLRAVTGELARHRRQATLLDIEADEQARRNIEQHLAQAQQWGGLILGEAPAWLTESLRLIASRRIPHVLREELRSVPDANVVGCDESGAGALIAEYLLTLGHRRVAYVGNVHFSRFAALSTTLAQGGYGLTEQHIERDEVRNALAAVDSGRRAGARLLAQAQRPSAIVAANDYRALGLLHAAAAKGLRVPQDLSIIGFDNLPEAAAAAVPLSSVRWPWREAGQHTVAALLAWEAAGPAYQSRRLLLPAELIVRASSGPAPAS